MQISKISSACGTRSRNSQVAEGWSDIHTPSAQAISARSNSPRPAKISEIARLYGICMITPQETYPKLAAAVGVSSLFLKREDLHPYGSHKGRSIPVMIKEYLEEGKRHFAISSSGNAALAAALYVKELNEINSQSMKAAEAFEKHGDIKLEILVGTHIPEHKLKKLLDLADENISVMRFERPLQTLTQKTADGSIQSLRQSTDELALIGYESLAEELAKIKDLQAVFMPTSSGTTAEALAKYFVEKGKSEKEKAKKVEIHIVQTTSCHPLAQEFLDSLSSDETSIADAIVDKTALRKDTLAPLVKKIGGSGWVATNEEIRTAQELIQKHAGFAVSPNGALGVAGLIQAVLSGKEWNRSVVCVIGGE
ncbi:MAG: PLP-dependent lyase/thiolase [Patescibacteria group bacterium]|nr:PLP-dependent lyase/thiolase [Patescibacteria group bacterium]